MSNFYLLKLTSGKNKWHTGRVLELAFDGKSDQRDEVYLHAVVQEEMMRLGFNKPRMGVELYRLPDKPTITHTWESRLLN